MPFLPLPPLFPFPPLCFPAFLPPLFLDCSVYAEAARASCCGGAGSACLFSPRPFPLGDRERALLRAFFSSAFSRLSSLTLLSPRLAFHRLPTNTGSMAGCLPLLSCRLLPELVLVFQTVLPAWSDHLFACHLLFKLEHVFT